MLPQAIMSMSISPFNTLMPSTPKRAASNPTKPIQESAMHQDEEEGFADAQPFVFETIATYLEGTSSITQSAFTRKTKNQLRNALCIYSSGPLYTYHAEIDRIPHQINIVEPNPTLNSKIAWLASSANSPLSRISQFASNSHMTCVYNRHAQNLAIKSDMTIYIRNVKTTVQCDMVREFTQPLMSCPPNMDETTKRSNCLTSRTVNKLAKLEFFSNFECGNLHSVFRENNTHNYYLFLQNDINTHGYNQWFDFWVRPVYQQETAHIDPKQAKADQKFIVDSELKNRHHSPSRSTRYDKQILNNKKVDPPAPVLQIIHSLSSSGKLCHYQQHQQHSHHSNSLKVKHQQSTLSDNNQNNNGNVVKLTIVNISKDIKYRTNMNVVTFGNTGTNKQVDYDQDEGSNGRGYKYETPFVYYKNKYQKYNGDNYMTIQFHYNFNNNNNNQNNNHNSNNSNSVVQFSLAYPYSYTKLINYLRHLRSRQSKWNIDIQSIGKSEGNNCIYVVKITNNNINSKDRKCIIVIARQHPGQPVSSFVCEHLMTTIIKADCPDNQHFDWFVIPMANPDGVIHGNSRTNLKGYDINRCWEKNSLFLCCEVQLINKFIEDVHKTRTVSYIIDLHGHSKDFGAFMYFCENNERNKVLSYLMSEKCSFYDYYKSKYGISYRKRPTFRGQMYYRMGIKNSITIETSLFGYRQVNEQGQNIFYPFTDAHYKQLSASLYSTLIQYEDEKEREAHKSKEKQQQVKDRSSEQGQGSIKTILLKVNELEKKRVITVTEGNDTETDSDSNPEDEYLLQSERKDIGIETVSVSTNKEEPSLSRKIIQKMSNKYAHEQGQKMVESDEYRGFSIKEQDEDNHDKPQRYGNRIYLDRFQALNRKNQTLKSKRKPIYTNSNVEILSYDKMDNVRASLKKYSVDQSGEFLSQKTLDDLNKAKNSASFRNKGAPLPSEKKVNGIKMKVKQSSVYPTATNVKIDREIMARLRQQNELFTLTKTWKQNDLRSASSLRKHTFNSVSKFKSTPSIKSVQQINKMESSTTVMKGREQEKRQKKYYQEYSKLKRYLLSRQNKSMNRTMRSEHEQESIQMNMMSSLAVVCQHAHRSQPKPSSKPSNQQ